MTDEEQQHAATDTVFMHEAESSHASFYVCGWRLEMVCAACGLVLYEGSTFEDPVEGWERFTAMKTVGH